ncbi:MAG: hypothetical protein AAB924_01300 [Patescibacteria group bacterium]|mgnify:CR=1 FL=1
MRHTCASGWGEPQHSANFLKVKDLRNKYGQLDEKTLRAQHGKGVVIRFLIRGEKIWQNYPPENLADLGWVCFGFYQPNGWKHIITSLEEVVHEEGGSGIKK